MVSEKPMEKSTISTLIYRYRICLDAINNGLNNWHGDIGFTLVNWWEWVNCDLDWVEFAEADYWSFWSMMAGSINYLPRKTAIDSIEHLRSMK